MFPGLNLFRGQKKDKNNSFLLCEMHTTTTTATTTTTNTNTTTTNNNRHLARLS